LTKSAVVVGVLIVVAVGSLLAAQIAIGAGRAGPGTGSEEEPPGVKAVASPKLVNHVSTSDGVEVSMWEYPAERGDTCIDLEANIRGASRGAGACFDLSKPDLGRALAVFEGRFIVYGALGTADRSTVEVGDALRAEFRDGSQQTMYLQEGTFLGVFDTAPVAIRLKANGAPERTYGVEHRQPPPAG